MEISMLAKKPFSVGNKHSDDKSLTRSHTGVFDPENSLRLFVGTLSPCGISSGYGDEYHILGLDRVARVCWEVLAREPYQPAGSLRSGCRTLWGWGHWKAQGGNGE